MLRRPTRVPAAGRGMALAQPGRNRKAEIAPSAAPNARGTGLPVGANERERHDESADAQARRGPRRQ
jgi:hypothetical protein